MAKRRYGWLEDVSDLRKTFESDLNSLLEPGMAKKRFGWLRDLPDFRDKPQLVKLPVTLPRAIDLSTSFPPILDQGDLGSCTAQAAANAHLFDQRRQKLKDSFLPSRLFTYYETRKRDGNAAYDSGASIRDTFKIMAAQGACPETMWGYDVQKFSVQPPRPCYVEALRHQAILYQRIPQSIAQLKAVLASGFPFVFGFSVYTSFESRNVERTGVVNLPKSNEALLGGHAVCCVGYDDTFNRFKIANSWGVNWGAHGYFTMPYVYLTDPGLASDFWVVKLIEG